MQIVLENTSNKDLDDDNNEEQYLVSDNEELRGAGTPGVVSPITSIIHCIIF